MVAGFERYYQVVKCFRDEDLRADRQPEFTQLDIETSFIEEDRLFDIIERMIAKAFKEILGIDLVLPLPALTMSRRSQRFGLDKPGYSFSHGVDHNFRHSRQHGFFAVFKSAIEAGGIVKAMKVSKGERLTRKDLDDLRVRGNLRRQRVAYSRIKEGGEWQSPIAKFLSGG